jgi:hypothetical protein
MVSTHPPLQATHTTAPIQKARKNGTNGHFTIRWEGKRRTRAGIKIGTAASQWIKIIMSMGMESC